MAGSWRASSGSIPIGWEEHVEQLAQHAFRSERWEQAADYLHRAGTRAVARGANREAVTRFEQAVIALRSLPEQRDTLERMIDLHFEIRNSVFALGEHDRILEHLRPAEALARRLEDRRRLGGATIYMSQYYWREGDARRAVELGEQALAAHEQAGRSPGAPRHRHDDVPRDGHDVLAGKDMR